MEMRALGRSGLRVGRIALGTMSWGRDTDLEEAAAQLAALRDAGGNLVDTADVYADGDSERILGELLRGIPRTELAVATKAVIVHEPSGRRRNGSRAHLLAALDASLERLGLDHVDVWQLHCWDELTPLEESLGALDAAVQSGRARYAGVCNFAGWQTAKAATWQAAWPGRAPLVSAQVEYSLLERGVEREVVPAARDAGLGLLPWAPLGRGVLTGKYRHGKPVDSRGASGHYEQYVAAYLDDRCGRIVEALATAADGLCSSPLAVALAWVRDRPGVVAPLVGARTAGQLRASLAAEELSLPETIRSALDDVSAPEVGYPERA